MRLTKDQAEKIEWRMRALSAQHKAAQLSTAEFTNPLQPEWAYLQQSEQVLIQFMDNDDPTAEGHELEWGLVLYILHNPTDFGLTDWVKTVALSLGMPETQIKTAMYAQWLTILHSGGRVTGDGSIVADTKWNAFDPGWAIALVGYLYYVVDKDGIASFGTSPQQIALDGSKPLVLALMGDWGTGSWPDGTVTCPSAAVLSQIKKQSPDVVVHLGDVYYAGTPSEEVDNFMDAFGSWETTAFALNGNHEMYDGANGYFGTALVWNGPFSSQQGTSYFALTYNNVVILGLDTAYYDSSRLHMAGALVDQGQLDFIHGLDLNGKTVIVLTHHNPITPDGSAATGGSQGISLWDQVVNALGGQPPTYWYWGHIHNGIVYSAQSAAGPSTKGRCIGHGALPFGDAYGFHDNAGNNLKTIEYYAHTPFPAPDPDQVNRVLNGFAVLQISPHGTILETFYDQYGNAQPIT